MLQQCQEAIGYTFSDPQLLSRALTHSSVAPSRPASNERLEFLGDAVLAVTVCHELYNNQDELTEGEMTRVKSAVVSGETCAAVAREIGICKQLFLGKGMSRSLEVPQSVAAAVFEAIIGAIYLDSGLEPARQFVLRHLRLHIARALADEHLQNYKSVLQQYVQRELSGTPEYHLLDEKGPDHSKCFEVSVSIGGKHYPSAWGMTKKQAEQIAARRALIEVGVIEDDEGEDA